MSTDNDDNDNEVEQLDGDDMEELMVPPRITVCLSVLSNSEVYPESCCKVAETTLVRYLTREIND